MAMREGNEEAVLKLLTRGANIARKNKVYTIYIMQPYCLGRYVVTIVAQCVPLNVPFHLESGCPGNCVFLQICSFYNFMLLSLTSIVC